MPAPRLGWLTMSDVLSYAIVAPPHTHTSAGVQALYYLNTDLRAHGHRSRIVLISDHAIIGDNEIIVYPDTVWGNPLGARRVVRYLLMTAGFFGHDTEFPASEMLYYHSKDFVLGERDKDNILTVPVTNEDRFQYRRDGREGSCYLARKYKEIFGHRPTSLPEGCTEITHETDLEDLFSKKKTLITFDNSAINLEAALAGMSIEFRLNTTFESPISLGDDFDWNEPRASYKRLKERYLSLQLPSFITRTQWRFQ